MRAIREIRKVGTVVVLAVTLTAGLTYHSASPASAATVMRLAGNFVDDDRTDIFEYRPGTGADYIFWDYQVVGQTAYASPISFSITGTYTPAVGDFNGDGYDEIFWYGGGDYPDHIWEFNGAGPVTQHEVSQGSLYFPVVGDFTADGADDILWYAPGTVADEIWEYDPVAEGLAYTERPINITGTYVALAGRFTSDAADDVILYGRGSTPDHLFDFQAGAATPTYTSSSFGPVTGEDHQPFTLDSRNDGWTDIFWYNPGTTGDSYWNFHPAGIEKLPTTYSASGNWTPAAGDLFGDGHDDVYFFGVSAVIWNWHLTAGALHLSVYNQGTSPN